MTQGMYWVYYNFIPITHTLHRFYLLAYILLQPLLYWWYYIQFSGTHITLHCLFIKLNTLPPHLCLLQDVATSESTSTTHCCRHHRLLSTNAIQLSRISLQFEAWQEALQYGLLQQLPHSTPQAIAASSTGRSTGTVMYSIPLQFKPQQRKSIVPAQSQGPNPRDVEFQSL